MPFVLVVVITVEKLARMPNVRGHIGTMDYRNTCPRCESIWIMEQECVQDVDGK